MRGGKRVGAGRPKGDGSKIVRVPLGCLNDVTRIIDNYKTQPLAVLNSVSENKPSTIVNKPISKKNIKWFNRKNDPRRDFAREKIRSEFGTLQNFINAGGRISKNTAFFPAVK